MNKIKKILKLQDEKSIVVIKNVFFSFFIKGLNIGVSFLTIPLVLSFLTPTQYGIWLSLTAIFGWFALFDLGFGNGLRNKLTKSLATKNHEEGKVYVSTTYAFVGAIFGALLILFVAVSPLIDWYRVFNAPIQMAEDLNSAVQYSISLLFLQFILRLVNTILLAFQRSAMADFTNAMIQLSILIGLFIVKELGYNSLFSVSVVYASVPIGVFLISSILLFSGPFKLIKPSFNHIKPAFAKGLLSIGLNFFIIQVAALILYASDNFIIAQYFDPEHVTTYNLAYKYFGVTNIIFTIVLAPFWSMTTKAEVEGDYSWIKKAVKKLLFIWLGLFACQLVQLAVSVPVYKLWTRSAVTVPLQLSAVMCLYFLVMNWGVIFGNFLNGVGKVRLQLYFSVAGMILNVPLAMFFIKGLKLDIIGVPLATICTMLGGNVIATIQYNKIIKKQATGIWNR
ncbi:oligosaccharide flippase family protein [Pedobacter sp. SYP-B3415]|uniref:oligosaccharide flippase family protein n=1 Tax=Pedobacter sp. SYP-B3415 TaxID=2496641 RepID=UPI00101E0116|nr:oligosaccharide flippase family protein [Pedobacter sp. SYP-B3415]